MPPCVSYCEECRQEWYWRGPGYKGLYVPHIMYHPLGLTQLYENPKQIRARSHRIEVRPQPRNWYYLEDIAEGWSDLVWPYF